MEKHFGLIGERLTHSLSPKLHQKIFSLLGLSASYKLIEIPKGELGRYINFLRELDGFNITIPYKKDIIPYLDGISQKASLIGSVNTVLNQNGRLIGYNTDGFGLSSSLRANGVLEAENALILGLGGVGVCSAVEMLPFCQSLTLAVRQNKLQMARDFAIELKNKSSILGINAPQINAVDISELKPCYDLIINCTPAGMFPNANNCPIQRDALKNAKAVFDCIYNPKETLLLKYARENGSRAINGMDMLTLQGLRAEEIWLGQELSHIRQELLSYMEAILA